MAQTEAGKTTQEKHSIPSFADWMKPETWTRYASGEQWVKAAEEQMGRVSTILEDVAKAEKVAVDQCHSAVQEMTRLTLASIDYSARLASEWRRSALEASRRGLDLARPKA
jgi:hypothetical protein